MNRTDISTRRGRIGARRLRRTVGSLAVVVLAAGLAACGSDDDSSDPATTEAGGATGSAPTDSGATEGGGSAEADAAAAAQRVEAALQPITEIGVDVPLTETPPTGLTVAWIGGGLQSTQPITPGYEAATEALGWDLVIIDYDPADPQTVNAAVQQAVDQGVDFIGISGTDVASFEQAAQAAIAAEIPIIDMYSTNETTGAEGNGIYAVISDADSTRTTARQVADWVIADSGGTANAVFVNLPEFPILQISAEAAREHYATACPGCTFDELDVTLDDLVSGAIPAAVVSYLQTHPDTNYVSYAIGDLFSGVAESLSTSGLEGQAQQVGGVPNAEQVQSLIDKQSSVWAMLPREESAWHAVDAMARLSIGQDLSGVNPVLLTALWDQANVPTPVQEYRGADGYEDAFAQLWGV
jgi:ABC-type sugar transport system substrate-binding protein